MTNTDRVDPSHDNGHPVTDIIVNSHRFLIGRLQSNARVDYGLPADDITVSAKQFEILKLSQGYFIRCLSRQYHTKVAVSRSPYLLRHGMVIDLGSPFSAVIRLEVFMPADDSHFNRKYHDYYRFVKPKEYSSRLSHYNREIGKYRLMANKFKKSSSSGNLIFKDNKGDGEIMDFAIEERADRVWDDLGKHYPPMVLKITQGKEHFKDPVARKGWLILNMTDTHTIGRLPECTLQLDTNLVLNHTLSIKFDSQRGWILRYLINRDITVGAFIVLKNARQLNDHRVSDAIKLYQGMQIVAGYHMFEVASLLEISKQ